MQNNNNNNDNNTTDNEIFCRETFIGHFWRESWVSALVITGTNLTCVNVTINSYL